MATVMQSLIKIPVALGMNTLMRDIYKGQSDAFKGGQAMGKSFSKGFDTTTKANIGNITKKEYTVPDKFYSTKMQNRFPAYVQEFERITGLNLANIKPNKGITTLLQRATMESLDLQTILGDKSILAQIVGLNGATDIYKELARPSVTLKREQQKIYRELQQYSIMQHQKQLPNIKDFIIDSPINSPVRGYKSNSYERDYLELVRQRREQAKQFRPIEKLVAQNSLGKASLASRRAVSLGNPILNNSAGYAIGQFFGSPLGMGLGVGALGVAGAISAGSSLADVDNRIRRTAVYLDTDNPLNDFQTKLQDTLKETMIEYGLGVNELLEYITETSQAGFDIEQIKNSLKFVGISARGFGVDPSQLTELIVTGANNGFIDATDPNSIEKYFAMMIGASQRSKATLPELSSTFGSAQSVLQSPGMTAEDYLAIMGTLADSNIRGSRGGRLASALFTKLFVPDSQAAEVDAAILAQAQRDGINIDSEQLKSLSDYKASLNFSIFDKQGQVNVGEGKKYANYVEVWSDLAKRIKESSLTEAQVLKMGSLYGQQAQRAFLAIVNSAEELRDTREYIVDKGVNSQKTISGVEDLSKEGIGYYYDRNMKSQFENLKVSLANFENQTKVLTGLFTILGESAQGISNMLNSLSNFYKDKAVKNAPVVANSKVFEASIKSGVSLKNLYELSKTNPDEAYKQYSKLVNQASNIKDKQWWQRSFTDNVLRAFGVDMEVMADSILPNKYSDELMYQFSTRLSSDGISFPNQDELIKYNEEYLPALAKQRALLLSTTNSTLPVAELLKPSNDVNSELNDLINILNKQNNNPINVQIDVTDKTTFGTNIQKKSNDQVTNTLLNKTN